MSKWFVPVHGHCASTWSLYDVLVQNLPLLFFFYLLLGKPLKNRKLPVNADEEFICHFVSPISYFGFCIGFGALLKGTTFFVKFSPYLNF